MNKIKRIRSNNRTAPTKMSSRLTRMANGDIIIKLRSRVQWIGLLFIVGFSFFWYNSLLFSNSNKDYTWFNAIKEQVMDDPFILIFIIAPLIMLGLSLKNMIGFGGARYRFAAVEHVLYQNGKKFCEFGDVEAIVISYDTKSTALGHISLKLNNGAIRPIYASKVYNELSLNASAIAGIVQVRIET